MARSLVCVFLTHHSDPRRKEFVWAVKNCRPIQFGRYEGRDGRAVALEVSRRRVLALRSYLEGAALVPVPPSGAGVDEPGDDLWPGTDLAKSFAEAYGVDSRLLLRRRTAIEKSSNSPGRRKPRRQVESLELTGAIPQNKIVLVDDVVASGATMCGCAEFLWQRAPQLHISGFAVAYSPRDANEELHDFAARKYEWSGLDTRPRNYSIPSPLNER